MTLLLAFFRLYTPEGKERERERERIWVDVFSNLKPAGLKFDNLASI